MLLFGFGYSRAQVRGLQPQAAQLILDFLACIWSNTNILGLTPC